MMLAVVRQRLREGRKPPRDIVLAFLADEEAGGNCGARWLVDNHPELFEGVTEAIGEVGGFTAIIGGQRLYLVETAQKGMAWLRLTARGTAGPRLDAPTPTTLSPKLAEAVARIGRHEWPVRLTPSVAAFLEAACAALGVEVFAERTRSGTRQARAARQYDRRDPDEHRQSDNAGCRLQGERRARQAASAHIDGRFLPGHEEEFLADIDELLGPNVRREDVNNATSPWRPRSTARSSTP